MHRRCTECRALKYESCTRFTSMSPCYQLWLFDDSHGFCALLYMTGRVRPLSMHNHVMARTELKTRSKKDVPVTHSELGCAPKRADHMVSAYDAMDVPDTSMLLMIHTGRRSMKGGLFGRPHEYAQQLYKRLPKTLASCAPRVTLA